MTKIEIVKAIIKNNGSCLGIPTSCSTCIFDCYTTADTRDIKKLEYSLNYLKQYTRTIKLRLLNEN
jgi:hypothetical protein